MKKISLIIPCYNCSSTLVRCLDSIFSQTYKNIEVIAVNDGSKDNTLEILNEYKNRHSNLIVIDKKNGGVSAARNDAIAIATGDYVEFIDSDDNFISKDVLEKNVKLMEENNVDVVVFNFIHPCFQTHLPTGKYDLTNKVHFKKYYQDFFSCSMPWNKLFKKEHITELYDESMAFAEDELFNLANLKNIKSIYINNDVQYNYYCAPVVNKEEASAINKLFIDDDFHQKKDTIWYKCIKNKKKRDVIFKKYYSNEISDMENIRPFDFFFYDFAFMCHLDLDEKIKMLQCVDGIVKEKEFLKILKSKEKYGLKLKSNKVEDLQKFMAQFVRLGTIAFNEVKKVREDVKIYPILFGIFGKCFYESKDNLNDEDILAETMTNLKYNHTKEAEYTNNLILNCVRV